MNTVVVIGSGSDIDVVLIEMLVESGVDVIQAQYFDDLEEILTFNGVNHGYLVLNTKIDIDAEEIRDPLTRLFENYGIPLTVIYTAVDWDRPS